MRRFFYNTFTDSKKNVQKIYERKGKWIPVQSIKQCEEIDNFLKNKVKLFIESSGLDYNDVVYNELFKKKRIREFYKVKKVDENYGYAYFGILDESGEKYDITKFGHILGNDDLQGGAIKIELFCYGDEKEDETLMTPIGEVPSIVAGEVVTTGVSEGALLTCSFGTAPSPLKVTSQLGETTNGLLDATEGDIVPFVNIMPFGNCIPQLGVPCSCPGFGPWTPVSKGNTINGQRELLNVSVTMCSVFQGVIVIAEPMNKVKKS